MAWAADDPAGAKLGSSFVSDDKVHIAFEARLQPGSPSILQYGQGTLGKDGIYKRHAVNFDGRTYAGYDLRAEPLPDGRVRLRFAELSIAAAEMSKIFKDVPNWTPLARPADAPAMIEVRDGETITVVLYVNSSTGHKVTDSITVRNWQYARNQR
ncbi:MAG: hypothetical protein IT162_14635 [Bryobacterales bacterium]|nr:hypothetical protein [Bryobacterales bacterium]